MALSTRDQKVAAAQTALVALRAVADEADYETESSAVETALDNLLQWAIRESMLSDPSGMIGQPLIRMRQIIIAWNEEVERRKALEEE